MKSAAAPTAVPLLPGERRFPFRLLLFGALSLLAHAATFFLFQVTYPPRVTIPPAATQVALLSGDDPEQQALLRWVESEDPSLVAASAHPVPPQLLQVAYEPSFRVSRTPPRSLPAESARSEPPPGPSLGALLRTVTPASASRQPPAKSVTRLQLSGGLAGAQLTVPSPAWKAVAPGPLEEFRAMVAVNREGEVRFVTRQKSSGDAQTDEAALAGLSQLRFKASGGGDLVWGFATIIWGDDAYEAAAPAPAFAMIRVNLSLLVLIYLGLMVGPVLALWLLNEFRRQQRERAAFRYVVRCGMCAFEFEDRTETLLPKCPRCASLTERYRISRL